VYQLLVTKDNDAKTPIMTATYTAPIKNESGVIITEGFWTVTPATGYSIDGHTTAYDTTTADLENGVAISIGVAPADAPFFDDIIVTTIDIAGNSTTSTTFVEPLTLVELHEDTGVSGTDSITSNGQIDIEGLLEDHTWQYSLDGGATWTTGTGNHFDIETEGVYTVQVRQLDEDGNPSASISLVVEVDTTAPTLESIILADTALKAGETTEVTFTFSEAVTNFANEDITVANGTLTAVSSTDGGLTWTGTFTPTDNVEDASNAISVNDAWTDTAGNTPTETSYSSGDYEIDTQRPSKPTILFSEGNNTEVEDHILTNEELSDDGDLDIKIGLPENLTTTDTLHLVISGSVDDASTLTSIKIADTVSNPYDPSYTTYDAGSTPPLVIDTVNNTWSVSLTIDITESMISKNENYIIIEEAPKEGHSITIQATIEDASGNISDETTNYIIRADETAPMITTVAISSDAGVDNTYVVGDDVSVTVTYDENVTVDKTGGTPSIELNIGGTAVNATYASGTGTSNLVFTYTILAGQTDTNGISVDADSLTLNSGTIQDASGNDATLIHTAVTDNALALVDTTADQDNNLSITSIDNATTVNIIGVDADVNDADVKISKVESDDSRTALAGSYVGGVFTLNTALVSETTLEVSVTDTTGNTATSVETYSLFIGTSDANSLTITSNNQYDFVDLGTETDSIFVSDNVTIDLSNIHNVETISLGAGSSLTGSGGGKLTLGDLGLVTNGDSIIINDSNAIQDSSITIDISQFTDANNDNIPDAGTATINTDGDAATLYTTTDGHHTIQIENTIDVVWQ
jgi:hypothetical protein